MINGERRKKPLLTSKQGSFRRLMTVLLATALVLSCFSVLVIQVKADTYNQIPLWINIMEGAAVDETSIEKQIDQIFKNNGLNWRITSVVLDNNYADPDKSQDQPGDVRVDDDGYTAEENSLWGKGDSETKDKSGFKIFVVHRILDENGTDSGINGVSKVNGSTAIVAQPSSRVPPIEGDTWAHEIGHLFGLGHENQDGSDRSSDNLMYPYRSGRNGTKLTAADIAQMNASKMERELGVPSLTNDQLGRTYNMYRYIGEDLIGDSFYPFTDILRIIFGFYILDNTRMLHITTYLNGLILPSIGLHYYVALDTDNDPTTGGFFMGIPGIDYLVEISIITSEFVEAFLYKFPEHLLIAPLEARVDLNNKFICTENSPSPPPLPISNSLVVSVPLMMLGPLTDPISVASYIESADGLGSDWLEKMPVSTKPPERPQLTFDPPVGPTGSIVRARGSGFTPSHDISIVFAHDYVGSAVVQPDGTFETTFIVPNLPPDHYMVDAIEHSYQFAVNMFTITSPSVGGFAFSVDKVALVAPYVAAVALLIASLIAIYVQYKKKKG